MALQDLAGRSGFTHARDEVVFLQLELPSTQPHLRELFSCQLQIDDEEGEWRVSDKASLYHQLQVNVGREFGVIGNINIPRSANRTKLTNNNFHRPLSLFGRETLLKDVNTYGFDVQARVRTLSVERQSGRIWLVRGEILSGGLIFSDPMVIESSDRERVWPRRNGNPRDNFRGIFFTGSELQIEIGGTTHAQLGGVLPGNQPVDRNRVRIPSIGSGSNGLVLFRARIDSQASTAWGEWRAIRSWSNGIAELLEPYSPKEAKPQAGWEYQIYRGEPVRRFRLLGVNRKPETGAVHRVLWEQISAGTALSQLPGEPTGLPIEPPVYTVDRHFEATKAIGASLGITIKKQEQTASRCVVVVEDMDATKPTRREYLRVDWILGFDQRIGNISWSPQSLLIHSMTAESSHVEFFDHDMVEAELRGELPTALGDSQVQFKWGSKNDRIKSMIPETRLIGTAVDVDLRSTEETHETSREIWFPAFCADNTPYQGSPLAWANLSAQQPPAVPVGDGSHAVRLSGPIVCMASHWTLEARPVDPDSGRATGKPGVRLTLNKSPSGTAANIALFAADVTLDSPRFPIYTGRLNDPRSVPNERRPRDTTVDASLRFIHRPEWERVAPGDDKTAVVCKYHLESDDGNFVIRRSPHAMCLYLPAERALVDPVSVTRGNLVGQQSVAFPVLLRPSDPSDSLEVVSAIRGNNSEGKSIVRLSMRLSNEEFPDDEEEKLSGFFAQLTPRETGKESYVVRIQKLERHAEKRSEATLDVFTDQDIQIGFYRLTVGPTRLALPRDVNHGLIPIRVRDFQISIQSGFATLHFAENQILGEDTQSVLALHPWSEWGPRPEASENPKRPWLTTGRVRLHHRNLIQEHAEFESSFEDRFPPGGPAKNPDGSIQSPLLPWIDFSKAVRDRFTEMTGNVIAPSGESQAKAVRNWLPHSKLIDNTNQELHPRVEMALDANDLTILPAATVRTDTVAIAQDPFSYKAKDSGVEKDFYQSLKLRKATEPGADQHWLDISVRPEGLAVGKQPTLTIMKTDGTDVTSRRAVDSSVPLLFSRHDTSVLATIELDNGGCITVVGSPEQPAASYLFAADGSIDKSHAFPGEALVDVALLRQGDTIRGLAIRKVDRGVELIRFTLDSTSGLPNIDAKAIKVPAMPIALACPPSDSSACIFVLTESEGVFEVNVGDRNVKKIVDAGENGTAIGADRIGDVRYLAVGASDGTISVWHQSAGGWTRLFKGKERDTNCKILGNGKLGNGDQELREVAKEKVIAARPIRGLCVLGHASHPIVVAVDGTRFPCVWGADSKDAENPRVWLQPSEALCVTFGKVRDLELRDKDATLPYFALGLRSGLVRMSAVMQRPATTADTFELLDVRHFDTAETPIAKLALVGRDENAKPVILFAGTAAGRLLAWEARSGNEWSGVECGKPTAFLDGLGVVRSIPVARTTSDGMSSSPADLVVDRLSLGTDEPYYSVTTRGTGLVVDEGSGLDAKNLTDIQLWANSFKVHADGAVDSKQFSDGSFDPGHVAFFSSMRAAEGLRSLSIFDYVPRLSGIPFFVTGVRTLKLTWNEIASEWVIETAELEGVLINPDEIAAGQDPSDAGTLPGVIARALSRGSKIGIQIESGGWSVVNEASHIDWTFAVNRQTPSDGAEGFPAALARICSLPGTVQRKDNSLTFGIDSDKSRAHIFGRLWPLSDSVELVSHAVFQRKTEGGMWEQISCSFGTSASEETLTCEHLWELPTGDRTLSADPNTLVWNGGRYISFHQPDGHKVFVADRATGLAVNSALFDDADNAPEIPTTAVLESLDETGEPTLTVAASRATDGNGRIDFAHWKGESLAVGPIGSAATKASWTSVSLAGHSILRLCGSEPLSGKVDRIEVENNLAQVHATEGSPLPLLGSRLSLNATLATYRVIGIDREARTFALAQDLVASEASGVGFLQFVRRIKTAIDVEKGSYRLLLSDSGPGFAIDQPVRVVAAGKGQFGKIVSLDGPVVSLPSVPESGSRIQKLFAITEVVPPDGARPTVRLKTDTSELIDRFLCVHKVDHQESMVHLAANVDSQGFDLLQPVQLASLEGATCTWRAVYPILDISHTPGEAKVDLGVKSMAAFTQIRITNVVEDMSLDGDWVTIPVGETTVVWLCRVKNGDGATITDSGTWAAKEAAPIRIAAIGNSANAPIVVTTIDEHGLIDGDVVVIADVVGSADVNGQSRVRVVSSKEFNLYKVVEAPTAGSGGFWERLDQDVAISSIAGDQVPAVLTATEIPVAYSRFRLIKGGTAQNDIFLGGPIPGSMTTWEALREVSTVDVGKCYWSPMVAMIPGDVSTAFLRSRSAILPRVFSTAALAYDRFGRVALSEKAVRVVRSHLRGCYLAQEVSEFTDQPINWSNRSKAVAVTVANEKDSELARRLVFDEIPSSGDVSPSGTTTGQIRHIEFLEAGLCGGQSVAVTADSEHLNLWPIDVPESNIEPTQSILMAGSGHISSLTVRKVGNSLWVAVVRGGDLLVYRFDDVHTPPQSTFIAGVLATAPRRVFVSFTEHGGDVIAAVSDGTSLKTWRFRVNRDGSLAEPELIWGKTQVTDSIVSLTGGMDGSAATFLIGLEDKKKSRRTEAWSIAGFVTIPSDEENQLAPRAALGVKFGKVPIHDGEVSARLHPTRRVRFNVKKGDRTFRAFAQIEQGNYRCLTLHPTTLDAKRGRSGLTLWVRGDLQTDVFDQAVGPLELCVASVELQQTEIPKQRLKFTIADQPESSGTGAELNTIQTNATVYSRSLLTYVGSQLVSKLETTFVKILFDKQTMWILLESDVRSKKETSMTGVLMLLPSNLEQESPVQAVVRCSLDLVKGTLELVDDVYWTSFVKPDADTSSADILLPQLASRSDESPRFVVASFESRSERTGRFVRLKLTQNLPVRLGAVGVDASNIPLIPQLESTLVRAPDRISDETVRLAHRLRAGLIVRPSAGLDRFLQVPVRTGPVMPVVPKVQKEGGSLLLETVVTVPDGSLVRLRPEAWLVPKDEDPKDESRKNFRTDGLFVLNVDFRPDDMPVVCTIESRTREYDPAETRVENERKRYRRLLRASGAQGVAFSYHLTDGQGADLGFIDSPLFDHAGDFYDNSVDKIPLPVVAMPLASMEQALARVGPVTKSWGYGFDPRLRLPGSLGHERSFRHSTDRYMLADLSVDPYADVCCLAHRQYRLQRLPSQTAEEFGSEANTETPILHIAEVPAFRQPARLSTPLSGRWLRTGVAGDNPSIPRVFFPPRVDWELAADKPGAMFQSVLQSRVTASDGRTRREPLIDFAIREPQYIRLGGCVTADVYWQEETKVSKRVNGHCDVNLVWTEVVGNVEVKQEQPGDWLKPTATGIAMSRTPLQLVIDFNSEVILVNQGDAAVPAYRVEAQPDGGKPNAMVLPAATFLVANPTAEAILKPQAIKQTRKCSISKDGDIWKGKFTDGHPLPLSGAGFTVAGISHRFMQPHGQEFFELMQDTAIGVGGNATIHFKIDGVDITAEVVCRRPLCVKIEKDPNSLDGATVITADVEILRSRDGVNVDQLRLAQIVEGENRFLVVTPSNDATAGEVECHQVVSQADGFLEAAVRHPVEVKATFAEAWRPALSLGDNNSIKLIGEHKLVRLDGQDPVANGVFGVLGKNFLARPVVGNGETDGQGKAKVVGDSQSVKLKFVEGVTPVIVTLSTDPNWVEGETVIVVEGVVKVPQANGVWIVQKMTGKDGVRYALYDPSVVASASATTIQATASAVLPLREAFPSGFDLQNQPRLRRLKLDPSWKSTDRPVLQVHWAGAAQFPNEDGKGFAWRQGGVMVGMYEQIKQVKFLASSQLSPKLAFVMTASNGIPWQRTILFGDSAPPFRAEPSIESMEVEGVKVDKLILRIPNNRESLSVALPKQAIDKFVLHLVKSMPSGVLVYDWCTKTPVA